MAKIPQSFHNRAVFPEIESIKLILILLFVFRGDVFDEIDVLVRVEGGHNLLSGSLVHGFGNVQIDNLELGSNVVDLEELVGHGGSEGFHGVPGGVMEGADHVVVVVDDVALVIHLVGKYYRFLQLNTVDK